MPRHLIITGYSNLQLCALCLNKTLPIDPNCNLIEPGNNIMHIGKQRSRANRLATGRNYSAFDCLHAYKYTTGKGRSGHAIV